MKHRLLFLLTLLLTTAILSHAYDFEVDGIYYNINGENVTVTYENYNCGNYSGNKIIPESVSYNGTTYSVTSIGDRAFDVCSGLISVTIPNSVTSIGNYAFDGCSGLTEVTIPDSVTSIGNHAFFWCSGLTKVTIGNSVTSIGEYAFYKCSGLKSVTIPDSVTSIGSHAFGDCSGLTEVTIPNSVTSISSSAFEGTALYKNEANWEDNVLYISDCLIQAKLSISGAYSIKDGTRVIAKSAFASRSGLTSVTIPNSVTSIDFSTFYGCSGLTEMTIPNSIIS